MRTGALEGGQKVLRLLAAVMAVVCLVLGGMIAVGAHDNPPPAPPPRPPPPVEVVPVAPPAAPAPEPAKATPVGEPQAARRPNPHPSASPHGPRAEARPAPAPPRTIRQKPLAPAAISPGRASSPTAGETMAEDAAASGMTVRSR